MPDESVWVFTDEAALRPDRQRLWRRYLVDTLDVDAPGLEWSDALKAIRRFLLPPCLALRNNERFARRWSPETDWLEKASP